MTKRRGSNEGSIYQGKDGRWVGALHVGYKGGKRVRKFHYGATRQEVAKKLNVAVKALQDGLPVVAERQTVKDFLANWLEGARPSLRDQTHSTYEIVLRLHAVPYLGHHRLAKLTPSASPGPLQPASCCWSKRPKRTEASRHPSPRPRTGPPLDTGGP